MSDRRRLLMQLREEGSVLPEGYYPCEYIESDGKQYINTRSEWNNQCRLVVDAEVSSRGCLFGVGEYDVDDSYIYRLSVYENSLALEYGRQGGNYTFAGAIGTRRVYDWNKNTLFFNDLKFITFDTTGAKMYSEPTLLAFAGYDVEEGLDVSNYVSAKLYACQMYNYNGELLRDYIPCFSATDGKFGLYDRVSKTFFGSETTIDFKGKLIVPEGYSGVEYIYGDGNAFIDTGFIANQNTRAIIDYEYPIKPTALAMAFGASYNGQVNKAFAAYLTAGFNLAVDYGQQTGDIIGGVVGSRIVFDVNQNIASVTHSGVKTTRSFTKIDFTCDNTLLILELNGVHTVAKVYFSAIWDNGTLVRLFAPCINSSNVYGLYDLVNGKFYQSAGSSQFGEEPTVYDFDYTGGEQSILLKAGNYKLETWGAQGGAGGIYTDNGGKGGYSVGVLNLKNSTTLYINVGGKGEGNGNPIYKNNGGYNGGGKSGYAISSECYPGGGGGGATHIATKTGLLTNLTSFKSDILIVAGGGGGGGGVGASQYFNEEDGIWEYSPFASKEVKGGDGGGNNGGEGEYSKDYSDESGKGGKGGTLSSSGSGGRRGVAEEVDEDDGFYISGSGGGGGGGYYGGGGGGSGAITGTYADDGLNGSSGVFGYGGDGAGATENDGWLTSCGGGGGGGSGYLAPSLTSASSNAGQRSGHGYARITKI